MPVRACGQELRRILDRAAVEGRRAARMEPAATRDEDRVRRLALQNLRSLRHPRIGVRDDRDQRLRVRMLRVAHDLPGGPFLHDHGIKRTQGCVACHDPHGSMNKRMLTYPRTMPLCLQCHPENPHDLKDRRYERCLDCHTEIHGSDLDRRFLR